MATYSKETALYDTGAIAGDISEAGNTATRYITAVDQNGIKVHAQNNTSSNYAQINANGMEVFKGGTSVALYGDTARVGAAASPNVTTSSTGVKVSKDANNYANVTSSGLEVYKGGSSVASFGSSVRLGKTNEAHFVVDSTKTTYIDSNGVEQTYVSASNGVYEIENNVSQLKFQIGSGFEMLDAQANSLANFSSTARIGATTTGHTIIQPEGMQVYGNDGTVELANIGYGSGNAQSGTANAPYYTLGRRSTGTIGNYSMAEGLSVIASGFCSHAEGNTNTASGSYSHAEGNGNTASGADSHAEGSGTTASGAHSHAEGEETIASGTRSHAEGRITTAVGNNSHAGGFKTIANGDNQTAIGKYNVADSTSLFIIGNGTGDNARANAFRVNSDGDIFPSGGQYLLNGTNIYSRNSGDTAWFSMLACTANNNTNLGYGGWDNSVGATGIYGNAVNVYSKGNLDITATQTSMSGTLKVQGHDSAIGTRTTGNSSKSIASGSTLVALSSKISLTAGTWLLLGGVEFPANATGVRRAAWYDGGGSSYSASIVQVPSAGSGYNTRIETVCTVTISSNLDMYIYCGQNSGSSLTVSYSYQVVRIA